MQCDKCGAKLQPEDVFCPGCGIKVKGVSKCPYCGGPIEPGDTFCGGCGKTIATEKEPIPTEPKKEPEISKVPPTQEPYVQKSSATSVRYAGFWMRFFALFLDWIILSIIFAPLVGASIYFGFFFIDYLENIIGINLQDELSPVFGALTYSILFFLYFLICHSFGSTIGKKIVGIRLITAHSSRPGFWRALLRETIGRFLAGLIFYLGYLWIAWDSHKQGWHDKVAGTFCVRTR